MTSHFRAPLTNATSPAPALTDIWAETLNLKPQIQHNALVNNRLTLMGGSAIVSFQRCHVGFPGTTALVRIH